MAHGTGRKPKICEPDPDGEVLTNVYDSGGLVRQVRGRKGRPALRLRSGRSSREKPHFEAHLKRLESLDEPPNAAMLERLKQGGRDKQDVTFYEHELIESDFMNKGMDAESAHLATLEKQGLKHEPGVQADIYRPEVIRKHPDYFNNATKSRLPPE